MKCDRVKELLFTDHTDGEIKANSREAVKRHIAKCQECREIEKNVMRMREAFHDMRPVEPPAYLWPRIKEAVSIKEAKKPAVSVNILGTLKDFVFAPRYVFARATAAALVILVMVFAGFAIQRHYMTSEISYQDEIGISSLEMNGSDASYNMGTAAEEYFL
jgi:anti-sigma factor RsiW